MHTISHLLIHVASHLLLIKPAGQAARVERVLHLLHPLVIRVCGVDSPIVREERVILLLDLEQISGRRLRLSVLRVFHIRHRRGGGQLEIYRVALLGRPCSSCWRSPVEKAEQSKEENGGAAATSRDDADGRAAAAASAAAAAVAWKSIIAKLVHFAFCFASFF